MPARIDRRNLKTSTIAGMALAGAFAMIVLAAPAQLAAQGDAPPPKALENLQDMEDRILRAKAESDRGDFGRMQIHRSRAIGEKVAFITAAFGGQQLHGCDGGDVIITMERLDDALLKAFHSDADGRDRWLGDALINSRDLTRQTETCAPSGPRAIVAEINERVDRMRDHHQKGRLSTDALRRGASEVSVLKRELVVGQRIYGCEVLSFYVLIERIDEALVEAVFLPGKADERRGSHFRRAAKDAEKLIERWRMVPCGGATPPPEPASFAVEDRLSWFHAGGFGNPPSWECNFVSTEPPQAGAQVTDVITRPSPQSQVTKTATTNASGGAVISMEIEQTGTYTHQTTVTSQGGVQATDTESQTVTAETTGPNGQCPNP